MQEEKKEHRNTEPVKPRTRPDSYAATTLNLQRLLDRFAIQSQTSRTQWSALCPAHADSNPSLSISLDNGKVLLKCHAGCEFPEICEEIGLSAGEVNNLRVTADALDQLDVGTTSVPIHWVEQSSEIDWAAAAEEYAGQLTEEALHELAKQLGVKPDALLALGVGFDSEDPLWTFPERNARREVIGLCARWRDGEKKVFQEGRRGLYIPEGWEPRAGKLFIVEGASDVAAGLSHGLNVIGRPSATGGAQLLCELLAECPADCEIVVMGENDKKPDGSWPGKKAATTLATLLTKKLQRSVRWLLPKDGAKDLREALDRKSSISPQKAKSVEAGGKEVK